MIQSYQNLFFLIDLSYRERYLKELHKAGLDGRLRPLKKE